MRLSQNDIFFIWCRWLQKKLFDQSVWNFHTLFSTSVGIAGSSETFFWLTISYFLQGKMIDKFAVFRYLYFKPPPACYFLISQNNSALNDNHTRRDQNTLWIFGFTCVVLPESPAPALHRFFKALTPVRYTYI